MLVDPALLQLLAAFSIDDRVRIISNVFGPRGTFSANTLTRFYHAHGIAYRAAKRVYEQSRFNLPGRERDRAEFARILGALIVRQRPIIYVDEAHFNSQQIQKKAWATRD